MNDNTQYAIHLENDHVANVEGYVDHEARKIVIQGALEEMQKLTKEMIMLHACIEVVNCYHTLNIDVQWEMEVFTVENGVEFYVVPFELQAKTD